MKRPSAAMVVGFVALVAALSGTAVALPGSNTVTSGDIKTGNVRSSDIKNNSIKSGDVRNGALRAKDFKAGELPKGDKGDTGDAGTALAYATVNANGTVRPEKSKGVVDANVRNSGPGVYCFSGLPESVRSAVIASDNSFTENDTIASVAISDTPGAAIADCNANEPIRVRTFDVAPAPGSLQNTRFTIWFED